MGPEFQCYKMKRVLETEGGEHIVNIVNATELYT